MSTSALNQGQVDRFDWKDVDSSQIARLAYEKDKHCCDQDTDADGNCPQHLLGLGSLYVEFHNRKPNGLPALYRYDKVPPTVFDALVEAPSVGRELSLSVKGTYEYEKVLVVSGDDVA